MAKKLPEDMHTRFTKLKADLAKVRDELRDLHDEVGEVLESADSGYRELTDAVDTLSQYV